MRACWEGRKDQKFEIQSTKGHTDRQKRRRIARWAVFR